MERLNQTIKAYLRAFVGKEQDDWVCLLPMAEFAYNNSTTMGKGMSPFYANYGFHPVAMNPASTEPLNPASQVYAHWMQAVHNESRKGLEDAQKRMRRYTNRALKEPPAYQVGDLVMLNGRNIKTRCPTKKLDHKNHGPFQIEKIISPLAVRLTLPKKWKIHNTFHVSLLEPYRTSEHRAPPDPSKCSERLTTSNNRRNTMSTKLCPRSNTAEEITKESYTSSSGLTIQNKKTGRKNHLTTFQ